MRIRLVTPAAAAAETAADPEEEHVQVGSRRADCRDCLYRGPCADCARRVYTHAPRIAGTTFLCFECACARPEGQAALASGEVGVIVEDGAPVSVWGGVIN